MRGIRKDQMDGIFKAIDNMSKRCLTKKEREKSTEVLKLSFSAKNLNSSFLDRRIQAIRDLNTVIKNNMIYVTQQAFTNEFLIQWLRDHEVFTSLWDPRKTHVQLVSRS